MGESINEKLMADVPAEAWYAVGQDIAFQRASAEIAVLFQAVLAWVDYNACKVPDGALRIIPEGFWDRLEAAAVAYKAAGGTWEEQT